MRSFKQRQACCHQLGQRYVSRCLAAKRNPSCTAQLNLCDDIPEGSFVRKSYSFSRRVILLPISFVANSTTIQKL
jgi:hypothetical protein